MHRINRDQDLCTMTIDQLKAEIDKLGITSETETVQGLKLELWRRVRDNPNRYNQSLMPYIRSLLSDCSLIYNAGDHPGWIVKWVTWPRPKWQRFYPEANLSSRFVNPSLRDSRSRYGRALDYHSGLADLYQLSLLKLPGRPDGQVSYLPRLCSRQGTALWQIASCYTTAASVD